METCRLLEELITIDSRNPFTCTQADPARPETWKLEGNEEELGDYCETRLEEAGFTINRQPVHMAPDGTVFSNILATKGKASPSLLLYGHLDTVTARPWLSTAEALTPRRVWREVNGVKKETIVGLGANDMKAGLAVLLAAFKEFTPRNFTLKIAFGVDEEFYSTGANVLATSDFMKDVHAIIVPEIADGPNGAAGPHVISLGRLGRCQFSIAVPGTGGHGARAGDAAYTNAAVECAKIATAFEEQRQNFKDRFTFTTHHHKKEGLVDTIDGSMYLNRIDAGDGTLSIPSRGTLCVSSSFTPATTIAALQSRLQTFIDSLYTNDKLQEVMVSESRLRATVALDPRPTPYSEAYCTPADNPFVALARSAIDATIGFNGFNMGFSVADENVFHRHYPKIPILNIGPVGENCHRADEWVEVESIEKLEIVYRRIVEAFDASLE